MCLRHILLKICITRKGDVDSASPFLVGSIHDLQTLYLVLPTLSNFFTIHSSRELANDEPIAFKSHLMIALTKLLPALRLQRLGIESYS